LELINTGDDVYQDVLNLVFCSGDQLFDSGDWSVSLNPGEIMDFYVNVTGA